MSNFWTILTINQEQHEDLYKLRAITGHQGPLLPQDENNKGSIYNVMVEWETGEITEEPLSLIAADDPVTCAMCYVCQET